NLIRDHLPDVSRQGARCGWISFLAADPAGERRSGIYLPESAVWPIGGLAGLRGGHEWGSTALGFEAPIRASRLGRDRGGELGPGRARPSLARLGLGGLHVPCTQ